MDGAIRDPLSGRVYVYQAMRVTGCGDPRASVEDTLPNKLPQRKLTNEAARGYSSYGNQIGLATGQVAEVYHPGYVAKRLEIGALIGAAPSKNVIRLRPEPGDKVILLGGRTGRDGCGGATGSSKAHTSESLSTCGAEVQKGNAPEERKIQRLFRNPAVTKLIKRCNDFGAGGVSVAVGELAEGLVVNLDKVPKKYEGLDGTELAISESQERMAVVVSGENAEKFVKLAEEENLYQSSFKLFEGMKLGEFKPEFTKFFLNKTVYPQLVEELKRDNLFIKKCYEEFDEIQITNTSNKGYQRQLKPTVKKFVNAFIDNTYIGVTDENFDIASTLVPYFDKQETFEKALAIKEEKERLGTGNNILDEHLEEQDVFGDIDALARMIKSKGVSTLRIMSDIAKDNFTFEWLEKNDPKSYILGKLCHCCAFIEGKGFTYMKASIVNPDIQNLVIKDKNGVIVAKSTLYINRDQGYGIFNNLEINRDIHIDNLNEVFRKFQLGAVAFVDKYNKKHPDKPLRKINIGMENNKAKEQIEAEFEKEKDLLPSFKYSNYADGENNGDAASLKIQYTVWKEKDE